MPLERNMERPYSRFLRPSLSLVLCCSGPLAAARPEARQTGATWIENTAVRVELRTNASSRWWGLFCSTRDGDGWRQVSQSRMVGNLTPKERVQAYRRRWGVYYVFDHLLPSDVRTKMAAGSATMSFRLVREQLWMDWRVTVLGQEPLVLFECTGQSDPGLVPHTCQLFAEPMTYLVADRSGRPWEAREIAARENRGRYVHAHSDWYVAAFRPGNELTFFILWPEEKRRRRLMFSPNGFQSAWLDCPYVLCVERSEYSKDAHTLQHRAIGWRSVARTRLASPDSTPRDNGKESNDE